LWGCTFLNAKICWSNAAKEAAMKRCYGLDLAWIGWILKLERPAVNQAGAHAG